MNRVAALALALFASIAMAEDVTPGQKQKVIAQLASEVRLRYVDVDSVPAIEAALDVLAKSKDLHDAGTSEGFSELLSRTLRRFDQHFAVQWRPSGDVRPVAGETWFEKLDRQNSGFNRIEVLDGNVGYIGFWGFDEVNERSTARLAAVMATVASTDALIFDLRNNGGGSGDMVRLLSSYLLPGGIHLNSFYWRPSDSRTEFWTLDQIAGEKRTKTPVYVLTSKHTFSAAEEFAYNLKHLDRAEVVGEATKGGANPWQFFELGDGFRAAIPIAKAINPVTNSNWEHTGVEPDQRVAAEDALAVAYRSALATIRKTTNDQFRLSEIDRALATSEINTPGSDK